MIRWPDQIVGRFFFQRRNKKKEKETVEEKKYTPRFVLFSFSFFSGDLFDRLSENLSSECPATGVFAALPNVSSFFFLVPFLFTLLLFE